MSAKLVHKINVNNETIVFSRKGSLINILLEDLAKGMGSIHTSTWDYPSTVR